MKKNRGRFFPFIGSIDSCLERFNHISEIIDHVLQLTELDIFGTICHCFSLLFLMLSLYQKTVDFPSKMADFQHLKVTKIQEMQGLFYASF